MVSEDAVYEALFDKVERARGFRGGLYRQKCLRRRVGVRMRARGIEDVGEYLALLDRDPAEYGRLLRVLTINVSKFFRNPETWEVIRKEILPDLFRRDGPQVLWSAGTAAGEEAYSLAILAWEWLAARSKDLNGVRIIGTDIDAQSLEVARSASYPDVALSETPPRLKRRWFTQNGVWRLKEPVRSLVEFQQLDILNRPSFEADLILCRNLLIYLDRPAQQQVFKSFAEVLRPGGYLVLGRVENLSADVRAKFETVNARERAYRKR